jgi:hypothetical protein
LGCYNLIASLVDYSSTNKDELKRLIEIADSKTRQLGISAVDSFAVKYTGVPTPIKLPFDLRGRGPYKDDNGRERFAKTDRNGQ